MGLLTPDLMSIVCFAAGEAAFFDGEAQEANPWDAGTREYNIWKRGWQKACHDTSVAQFTKCHNLNAT